MQLSNVKLFYDFKHALKLTVILTGLVITSGVFAQNHPKGDPPPGSTADKNKALPNQPEKKLSGNNPSYRAKVPTQTPSGPSMGDFLGAWVNTENKKDYWVFQKNRGRFTATKVRGSYTPTNAGNPIPPGLILDGPYEAVLYDPYNSQFELKMPTKGKTAIFGIFLEEADTTSMEIYTQDRRTLETIKQVYSASHRLPRAILTAADKREANKPQKELTPKFAGEITLEAPDAKDITCSLKTGFDDDANPAFEFVKLTVNNPNPFVKQLDFSLNPKIFTAKTYQIAPKKIRDNTFSCTVLMGQFPDRTFTGQFGKLTINRYEKGRISGWYNVITVFGEKENRERILVKGSFSNIVVDDQRETQIPPTPKRNSDTASNKPAPSDPDNKVNTPKTNKSEKPANNKPNRRP